MKTVKPISVCWLITSRCNYNCPFCFKQSKKRELYFNEAEKVLEKLNKAGVKKISFSGGEPLLWPGLVNLIKKAKSLGIITMLITNGSLLNEEMISKFNGALDWITLPLDGSSEKVQQKVGRPQNHFTNTINILNKLKKRDFKTKINTVVCRYNLNDIKNIVKIVKKRSVSRWKLFQFYPIRDAALKNKNDYKISAKDFSKIEKEVKPVFDNSNCMIYFGSNKRIERSYFLIAPDATVYVSQNDNDYFLGDLKKQNASEIWQDSKIIDKGKYWKRVKWILNFDKQ